MGQLNARRVAAAKAGKHSDGDGLILVVTPAGSKRWIYRYQIRGRRRDMGLGSHPPVTLAEAREKAAEARALVRRGVDPLEVKAAPRTPTFASAAAVYIRAHRHQWARRHALNWVRSLRRHARPLLDKPVDQIALDDVLRVLQPIWRTKPKAAPDLRQRIEAVLNLAKVRGWRSGENPAQWRGNLELLLSSRPPAVHHPALPWAEVPALYAELPMDVAGDCLRLIILAAARVSELRELRWTEIEAELIRLPAERTKQRREHLIPMTGEMRRVLGRQPVTGGFVFEGRVIGRPVGDGTLRRLLKGLRPAATIHGCRSSFRDWCEETGGNRLAAELCLGHTVGSAVERAYRRSDLMTQRRVLLERWAQHVVGGETS